jgi:hypothetical protein
MTHPGVGWVTALATEVFLGDPMRFADGKAVASYIGMIPSEYSTCTSCLPLRVGQTDANDQNLQVDEWIAPCDPA